MKLFLLGSPYHLAKRFFSSIFSRNLDIETERRLLSLLSREEKELYFAQPRIDRIHSIRNAKSIIGAPSTVYEGDLIVAAALHDIGKAEAQLGVLGRVLATLLHGFLSIERIRSWGGKEGFRKQINSYCLHSERGAELLEEAGSKQIVITWARHHHDLEEDVVLPADIFSVLEKADRK